ncbi:TRAP transporter small permease subunit [Marinomonas colpomeniae]|uniref:TRAP transporter small permease protein n=1 Tax=Marinomonas colpomeniae TaxID=2774408 RepID=A0ABR8NU58_9GAMM|nr:TRAP transporter small permease [Marinomonas colpomeniae]MBD5769581.1 TRAP transporter small permease [Marinomonas colpomeniae]
MIVVLTKLVDCVCLIACYISGIAILAIALMQVTEIIVRNAFDYSFPFVWEFASYLHIGAVFLAAGYTLRSGGHIRVTILQRFHSKAFEIGATLVALAISTFLSMAIFKFAFKYFETGRTSGTVNDIPLAIPAFFMAFGAALLTVQLVMRLLQTITNKPFESAPHLNNDNS